MIKKLYLIFVVLGTLLLTGCKVLYGIVLLPVMAVDGVSNSIKAEVGEYIDANSDSTPRTIFYFDIPAEIPYEKDTGWLIKTDKGGLSEVPSRELTNEQLQRYLNKGFLRKAAVSCRIAVLYRRDGKIIWPAEFALYLRRVGGEIGGSHRWMPEWKPFSSVMYEEICLVSPEKDDDILVVIADPASREIRFFSQKLSALPDFKSKHFHRHGGGLFIQTCILDKGAFAGRFPQKMIKVPQWNKLTPLDGESKKYYQSKFFPKRVIQPNEHPVEEIE